MGQLCGNACFNNGTIDCAGNCVGATSPPANYGQVCGNACFNGSYDCDGNCTAAAPAANYGQPCNNACFTGTYDCAGTCNAMPAPANYGQECAFCAGCMECGGRGTFDCDGACDQTVPGSCAFFCSNC